jgi:hypothetical protein
MPDSPTLELLLLGVWALGVVVLMWLTVLLWRRGRQRMALSALLWTVVFVGAAYVFLGPVSVTVPAGPNVDPGSVQCFTGESSYSVALARGMPDDSALDETDLSCRSKARVYVAAAAAAILLNMAVIYTLRRVLRGGSPQTLGL